MIRHGETEISNNEGENTHVDKLYRFNWVENSIQSGEL